MKNISSSAMDRAQRVTVLRYSLPSWWPKQIFMFWRLEAVSERPNFHPAFGKFRKIS